MAPSTRCPRCGATYGPDAKFCANDGSRLIPVGAPPPAATQVAATQVAPASRGGQASLSNMSGQVLDGRYQVARKVGEGGMSFVYLATDMKSGERVAIKILSPSLAQDTNAMQRLRREAQLGERLAHPNVCHIVGVGDAHGVVYIVMPFVDGELLCDRTMKLGQIPLAQTARIVRDISAGLDVAHQLNIIHRDLKPENIMLTRGPDGVERAVVMDFGLAKQHRAGAELEKLTATGIVLGTPEFMSPEQLRGKPLDSRTDIYSLALMTYEMLTGKLPFTGRTKQDVMIARLRSEPIPLRSMRPELNFPVAVEKVLQKAMARDREERFKTAPEFAAALMEGAAGGGGGEEGQDTGWLQRILRR